jgi:hypothetical protein
MDAGQVKVINEVVTQGRANADDLVTSCFIDISSDSNTWTTYNATLVHHYTGSYLIERSRSC